MRLSYLTVRFAVAFGLAGVAACGSSAPEPATPAPATPPPTVATAAAPAAAAPTPPAAIAWSNMTNEQKLQHMKTVIAPTMGKVFQEGDAKRYADFGCKTCHGDQKQDPHVVLPTLTLSGDGFQKLMATKPAVTKFMAEKVTPAMASAMNEKPYDPATHKGFGCGGCHKVN